MTTRPIRRVAVVGAASQIGQALLPRLARQGLQTYRIGRGDASDAASAPVHVFDARRCCFTPPIDGVDALVSLAPLPVIASVLDMAGVLGVHRVIAFGSTGRFSKVGSSSALERDFVAQQTQAEDFLAKGCAQAGMAWTLFRPTMVYGAGADLNIGFVSAMVRRFGFFPLAWGAHGLRQPVHLDDLAAACVAVLECERSFGRAYNLGGGEVLGFPDLVRRVFLAAHKTPRLVPIPRVVYYLLIALASRFASLRFLRREMVDRMFQDLTVDNQAAWADFGYSPRQFSPGGDTVDRSAPVTAAIRHE